MRPTWVFAATAALALSVGGLAQAGVPGGCNEAAQLTQVSGETVQRPERDSRAPAGWTAVCRDGTYSFSENRRAACSSHGGVALWR